MSKLEALTVVLWGYLSKKQVKTIEKLGISPDEIDNAGKTTKLLEKLDKRRIDRITYPKQIRFLGQYMS